MKLLQFRIRSHPLVPDSCWCKVKTGINLLAFEKEEISQAILEYLATIHPHKDEILRFLEKGQNLHYQQGAITKKTIPHKKTAALTVFGADRVLIDAINKFDDSLYEASRVEIGRRLDLSRWMNFIEIPSSTRWSEVKPLARQLLRQLGQDEGNSEIEALEEFISTLQDSDRIRRGMDEQLITIMQQVKPFVGAKLVETYETMMYLIGKNKRFLKAKEQVFSMLPVFLFYTYSKDGTSRSGFPSMQITPETKIPDISLAPEQKSILLLDLTEANRNEILSFCSLLERVPCKQSIVAVSRSHLDLFPAKYHVIMK